MLDQLLAGFGAALTVSNLAFIAAGITIGIVIGAVSVVDMDGELVTPLVDEYQECAFAKKDKLGIWKCGIENAYRDGKVPVNKPLSCHLYPIRVEKLKYHDGLNYNMWDICKPACSCGAKLDVPVFRFLKGPLTRAYGADWYDELEVIYQEWLKEPAAAGKASRKGR